MAPDVTGLLELTTPAGTRTISTTETLRGLWWAPDGRELLLAQANAQGQNLVLVAPQRVGREPGPALITVPGVIQSVQWSPDGQAAVVLSTAEPAPAGRPIPSAATATPTPTQSEAATTIPTRSAVLIWRDAGGAVAATRLRAPPDRSGGVALLAWSLGRLWWGTDTGLGLALDQIDLATGSATRVGALPADLVALTVTADERVRVIRRLPDGALSVQRWPTSETLFTIPELQLPAPATRPAGVWLGQELILVAGPTELWYVRIDPEALQ